MIKSAWQALKIQIVQSMEIDWRRKMKFLVAFLLSLGVCQLVNGQIAFYKNGAYEKVENQ